MWLWSRAAFPGLFCSEQQRLSPAPAAYGASSRFPTAPAAACPEAWLRSRGQRAGYWLVLPVSGTWDGGRCGARESQLQFVTAILPLLRLRRPL